MVFTNENEPAISSQQEHQDYEEDEVELCIQNLRNRIAVLREQDGDDALFELIDIYNHTMSEDLDPNEFNDMYDRVMGRSIYATGSDMENDMTEPLAPPEYTPRLPFLEDIKRYRVSQF